MPLADTSREAGENSVDGESRPTLTPMHIVLIIQNNPSDSDLRVAMPFAREGAIVRIQVAAFTATIVMLLASPSRAQWDTFSNDCPRISIEASTALLTRAGDENRIPLVTNEVTLAPVFDSHQALSLAQRQIVNNTQGQTHRNCQVRIFRLATTRRPPRRRPLTKRLIAYPDRQITALSQAFIIRRPIRDLEFLLGNLVPSGFIELMRHRKYPGTKNGRLISDHRRSAQQGPFKGLRDKADT